MSDEAPRFLADGMLGRLARWLRLLGYDTVYDNQADDEQLAHRARAEHRVLLTRDRGLACRRGLQTVLIRSQELACQVREVQSALALEAGAAWPGRLQPRCSVCNGLLRQQLPRDVADRVPPYVMRTQRTFYLCQHCGRVYWHATHAKAMRQQVARIEDEGAAR